MHRAKGPPPVSREPRQEQTQTIPPGWAPKGNAQQAAPTGPAPWGPQQLHLQLATSSPARSFSPWVPGPPIFGLILGRWRSQSPSQSPHRSLNVICSRDPGPGLGRDTEQLPPARDISSSLHHRSSQPLDGLVPDNDDWCPSHSDLLQRVCRPACPGVVGCHCCLQCHVSAQVHTTGLPRRATPARQGDRVDNQSTCAQLCDLGARAHSRCEDVQAERRGPGAAPSSPQITSSQEEASLGHRFWEAGVAMVSSLRVAVAPGRSLRGIGVGHVDLRLI